MKKILAIFVAILLSIQITPAIEIAPFAGYSFQSTGYYYYGNLRFYDNTSYGMNLSMPISNTTQIELQWVGATQTGDWYDYYNPLYNRSFNTFYNYFLIGPVKEAQLGSPNIIGFGTFKLGMSYYAISETDYNSYNFAMSFGGGFKFFFTDVVGLRLQGNLHMPLYFNGIFLGTGSGGFTGGASGIALLVQGEISAGLVFKVGEKPKFKPKQKEYEYTDMRTPQATTQPEVKKKPVPEVKAKSREVSDNLDLKAIGTIYSESKNLEEFEKKINDPKLEVSNLDLSGDGKVDYLRVVEVTKNGTSQIVIQAALGDNSYREIATIEK